MPKVRIVVHKMQYGKACATVFEMKEIHMQNSTNRI